MSTTRTADPVATYLEEQSFHGKSERTLEAYERVLNDFRDWVNGETGADLADVERQTCMRWVHSLRGEYRDSTVASYASYVNRFYNYMGEIEIFDANPMALVIEQMDESIDIDPIRRDIAVPDMAAFVRSVRHPLTQAIVVTFLKTGIRVGELCNLDCRDVHLGEVPLDIELPTSRAALDGRPDAIYIDSRPSRGAEFNGEVRTASNKRQRDTIVPVDAELKRVLVRWLAIRPTPHTSAEPLFVDTGGTWGARLEPSHVRNRLRPHTEERGWYRRGADSSENVTPHYFRHFFTTHLRDRIGDRGIVKYLRGDVADDVIETYTHNWGDRVRRRYEAHIYSLF